MALTQQELNSLAGMSKEDLMKLLGLIREARALHGGGMTMSESTLKAMTDVVDNKLMQAIVSDLRTIPEPGFLPSGKSPPKERGSGWTKPLEHSSPSGLRYVDQICDAFADLDKRELQNKLRRL